jgi:glycosyltransferase involved in cell wall biosynthesis/predicted metal-dependent phosphoesterase TrpH
MTRASCDLHVHTRFSTDSGNYALRRARLGESYTDPQRVYDVCKERGMRFVTISDHNTIEGALRIAHLPDTFLSEEVTTRFPEDDVVLHVLVWNLNEEDHRDLQPYRGSVYELQAFLANRQLPHALAHPLYRMGPPITASHVERMMLLFGVWEGRNGARPRHHNDLASRLARLVTPRYLATLSDRHGLAPRHRGHIGLVGGSDDHSALDIATTWTDAEAEDITTFFEEICQGSAGPAGAHGSPEKLAHAVMALFLNAYRADGATLPPPIDEVVHDLFDTDSDSPSGRHADITSAVRSLTRSLGERSREGGFALAALSGAGPRVSGLLLAGALQVPFLGTAHHQSGGRRHLLELEETFFGRVHVPWKCRAMLFTDTFTQTNGVAGTMRRLAEHGGLGDMEIHVATSTTDPVESRPVINFSPEWSVPLPTSEHISLHFPSILEVLDLVLREQPDVIQVATPGPVGLCGLIVGKLLEIPVVGSYHTELGPYTLHLTRDLVVAEAMGMYVDWFYGRCDRVLAPTRVVADALVERGVTPSVALWSRGVDTGFFTPRRRNEELRQQLLGDGERLLLSVGRLSVEKRLDILLSALAIAQVDAPGLRLAIVGEGPARSELERLAGEGVTFLGELRGTRLAEIYASADIFCFPSTTDTFGQVMLEAGASGLPVIAAAAGGALELVRPGITGMLVDPDDPKAFAKAILSLVQSEPLRERLGEAGRQTSLRRTWESSLLELRDAYRSVLEPRPAPRARDVAA